MAQTAAHLVDAVIPRVPVRQWVVSFPIPLRVLLAAHPQLISEVLQIVHRVIATFLIKQSGLNRSHAHSGAITLIQRFGSSANINIHLHCLVLDGVYQHAEDGPIFHAARAPSLEELHGLLTKIITRILRRLTRQGLIVEDDGEQYVAALEDSSANDSALASLQHASAT